MGAFFWSHAALADASADITGAEVVRAPTFGSEHARRLATQAVVATNARDDSIRCDQRGRARL